MKDNQKILRQFYSLACPEEQVEDIIGGLNEAYTEEDLEVIAEKSTGPVKGPKREAAKKFLHDLKLLAKEAGKEARE